MQYMKITILLLVSIGICIGCTNYDPIKSVNHQLKDDIEKLHIKNDNLEQENNDLEISIESVKQKNLNLDIEINESMDNINKYLNDIKILKDKIKLLENENDDLKRLINSKSSIVNHKNPFSDKDINVLDTVCCLTLVGKQTNTISDMELVSLLDFRGTITVSGTFKHCGESEFFTEMIEFYPDETSSVNFPRVKWDTRKLWFILSDYNDIKDNFGEIGDSGTAKLVIDNYTIDLRETETANTAKLMHIIDLDIEQQKKEMEIHDIFQ